MSKDDKDEIDKVKEGPSSKGPDDADTSTKEDIKPKDKSVSGPIKKTKPFYRLDDTERGQELKIHGLANNDPKDFISLTWDETGDILDNKKSWNYHFKTQKGYKRVLRHRLPNKRVERVRRTKKEI